MIILVLKGVILLMSKFILFDGQLISKSFIQKVATTWADSYDGVGFYVYISDIDDDFDLCHAQEYFDTEESRDERFDELVKLLA